MFTVLQQDEVGGLQIKKDGVWLGVRPVEGAVIINVGDLLQVSVSELIRCKSGTACSNDSNFPVFPVPDSW